MILKFVIFFFIFLISYLFVGVFRQWAMNLRIMDVPNERSSHVQPTPRGGGVVIVIATLIFFSIFSASLGKFHFVLPYLAASILLSSVSWLDDVRTVPIYVRFPIHLICAAIIVSQIGFWQTIDITPKLSFGLGIVGIPLTLVWIVWMTNSYNFMDGIDGIAGVQALTAGLGWALTGYLLNDDLISVLGGLVAFSATGFLIHNWHPAKIFMGDVGSAFLGFTFAVIPLFSSVRSKLFVLAIALVFTFLIDSIFTLLIRLFRGEKVWEAHRDHFYQRLVKNGFSHNFVSTLYGVIGGTIMVATIYMVSLSFR